MMNDNDRRKAAQLLLQALKDRKPVVQLSTTWPGITIEDAYAIQSLVNEAKVAAGAKVRGHKVGLTSKAMQQSSQIDEPDYGVLMEDMFLDDGAVVQHADFCVPRVEMELGFVLGERLKGPGVGLLDVVAAAKAGGGKMHAVTADVGKPDDVKRVFDGDEIGGAEGDGT